MFTDKADNPCDYAEDMHGAERIFYFLDRACHFESDYKPNTGIFINIILFRSSKETPKSFIDNQTKAEVLE